MCPAMCGAESSLEPAVWPKALGSVYSDDLGGGMGNGRREVQEGGGMCVQRADSLCFMAETKPAV